MTTKPTRMGTIKILLPLWFKHLRTSGHCRYYTDVDVKSRSFKQGYEKTAFLFHTVQVIPIYF